MFECTNISLTDFDPFNYEVDLNLSPICNSAFNPAINEDSNRLTPVAHASQPKSGSQLQISFDTIYYYHITFINKLIRIHHLAILLQSKLIQQDFSVKVPPLSKLFIFHLMSHHYPFDPQIIHFISLSRPTKIVSYQIITIRSGHYAKKFLSSSISHFLFHSNSIQNKKWVLILY